MYCEQSEATHIDHFWPRAGRPDLTFAWPNWLLSCGVCNSEHKGEKFHLDMLDPTDPLYDSTTHFEYERATGEFVLRTAASSASAEIYGLNRYRLTRSRQAKFRCYQTYIIHFAAMRDIGNHPEAEITREAAAIEPHPTILHTIQRWYRGPGRALLLADCAAAIDRYPEVLTW